MSFAPGLQGCRDDIGYANDIFLPRFQTVTGDQEIGMGIRLIETSEHTDGLLQEVAPK
jgi:hypothetical protein